MKYQDCPERGSAGHEGVRKHCSEPILIGKCEGCGDYIEEDEPHIEVNGCYCHRDKDCEKLSGLQFERPEQQE